MANDADALAVETAETADDGWIVAMFAVASQRHELGDHRGDVVEAVRPLRVARHLRLLPGRQRAVEVLERGRRLGLDAADLLADRDRVAACLQRAQFLDLGLERGHRFFEIEVRAHQ